MRQKIKPEDAAYVLGISVQTVRLAMQAGVLPIGQAIKLSGRWTYLISDAKLAAYMGYSEDRLREILDRRAAG